VAPDRVTDVLVLGSGVAGLTATIHAANRGLSTIVLTKAALDTSATAYAQGGVAAALEEDVDSPDLHLADTLTAGAHLCDEDAVRVLVTEGPDRVRELISFGARFDRLGAALATTREGGHSVARVIHAGGDATGAEIQRALAQTTLDLGIEVRERWLVTDLLVEDGRAVGVRALDASGAPRQVRARHTVVATGGAGQCFAITTNPPVSSGDGIAMALRAGVAVADVEFMQFHPTALDSPSSPRLLISEAVRGEGAILRDDDGFAFMTEEHPLADLAPRDVVARAITRRCLERGLDHMWLDATGIRNFGDRFPTIWRSVRAVGLDPAHDFLPVAPAAHYLSGGVVADLHGASNLGGLWACGEAACSGVHGANRLASNSLLDGLVFGSRLVEAIADGKDGPERSGAMRGLVPWAPPATGETDAITVGRGPERPGAEGTGAGTVGPAIREWLQRIMTRDAGVLRDHERLTRATNALAVMQPDSVEDANLLTVGRALVAAALSREESRGTHTRLDFPERSARFDGRMVFSHGFTPTLVPLPGSLEPVEPAT
jgi:L-aspartate oxidase